MLDQIHRELQSLKDNHLFRTRKLLSGRLGSNLSFNKDRLKLIAYI